MGKSLSEIKKSQCQYVKETGGYDALREADDKYNDMNREQIFAFVAEYGDAYLGNINYFDQKRIDVVSGAVSPFEKYEGQPIYNFEYTFCIPAPDDELAEMIRNWNSPDRGLGAGTWKAVSAITNKIDQLGGIQFIWY